MKDSDRRFRLYAESDLRPVLRRMALQLAGRLTGELDCREATLVGLLRRGVPLADRLAAELADLSQSPSITRLDLEVKRYGDDLSLLYPETRVSEGPAGSGPSLAGRHIVLVDDVLYQGHSLARVLEWARAQEAASVTTVVLVDRLVSVLPIHADVVGLSLQIAPADVIECNIPPFEAEFAIDLMRLAVR